MGAAPSINETKAVEGFGIFGTKGGGGIYVGNRGDSGGSERSIDPNAVRNFFYGEDYLKDWTNQRSNTVKRIISSKSPIYIPLVMNLAFLFIVGSRYLYYYKERPTVEEFKKVFHPQKIDGNRSSSTGSSS
jgi:hypothetical protein